MNFTRMPSTSRGGNNFVGPQRNLQRTNENAFPTQKRNRSELLSLFGGRSRIVPHQQQQGCFSNETITPPQQNFSIVRDFDNISQKKPLPTTNNFFRSQAFDISLGDEDDFLDTSFRTLYNPENKTNTSSNMTTRLSDQPWHSDETDVIDVDEYLEAEIDNVLSDYDDINSTTNNFVPATSKLNSLPWETNKSQVTRNCNVIADERFDEEMDDVVFNADFGMFNTSSEMTRSLAGREVEYKNQSFRNPNVNSTCTPGRECGVSQVGVARNVSVNERFDPNFDVDDCVDDLAMFRTSSGKPKPVERGQSNKFPSTSRSFLQNRLHSSSRVSQFTPPLVVSVNNNPRTSSSYQQDCRSSNIEPVAVGTSLRSVSGMQGLVPSWSHENES